MAKKNLKAVDQAIAGLEKRFNEPLVMKMNEDPDLNIERISSGRPDLDNILGGGYPVGKIIEIYSEEACGKSGLALELVREVQKSGGITAYIDSEHALNTEYAESIGVNIDDLYISQPSWGEQAFEVTRALINTGEINLIVIDSVSALTPKAELDGESGEAKIALQARMMSQGMKMIVGTASAAGCTVLFINQLRDKINAYHPSKVTSGGNSLKFYASIRLELKRKGWIKEGEDIIGFKQLIKLVKSKVSTPFKSIENDIIYGKGVDSITSLVETAVELDVIKKKGSWFEYKGDNLSQGMAKLRVLLEDNPELVEDIEKEVKNAQK